MLGILINCVMNKINDIDPQVTNEWLGYMKILKVYGKLDCVHICSHLDFWSMQPI